MPNSPIKNFTDLEVWQLAHKFKLNVYKLTKYFPEDEKYVSIPNMKRAGKSISANIAEGFGRYHYLENVQCCRRARGELDETIDHLISARDLKHASMEECNKLIKEGVRIRQVLNGYIRSILKQKEIEESIVVK